MDLFVLGVAALMAGLVDAVVGGGGLIQLPVLFSVMPHQPPATLFGTSKLAGIFGTTAAAFNYARRVRVAWSAAAPAAVAAFAMAFAGAYTVTRVPADFVRLLLPVILFAVAVYTFRKKDFGSIHAPAHTGSKERWLAVLTGASIGFYDGFFGPGTGSFLIFFVCSFLWLRFSRRFSGGKGSQCRLQLRGIVVVRLCGSCALAGRPRDGGLPGGRFVDRYPAGGQTRERFCTEAVLDSRGAPHRQDWLRRLGQAVMFHVKQ